MFKFSFSVRAYYGARYYGFPHFEEWDSYPLHILAAHAAMAGRLTAVNHKGNKVAVELLRAGGFGIYQIAELVPMPIERIRELCNRLDMSLHGN